MNEKLANFLNYVLIPINVLLSMPPFSIVVGILKEKQMMKQQVMAWNRFVEIREQLNLPKDKLLYSKKGIVPDETPQCNCESCHHKCNEDKVEEKIESQFSEWVKEHELNEEDAQEHQCDGNCEDDRVQW